MEIICDNLKEGDEEKSPPGSVILNTDGHAGEEAIGGHVGFSHHEVVTLKILGDRRKVATSTPEMERADSGLLRELVSGVPWETAFKGIGVIQRWSLFRNLSEHRNRQLQNVRSQAGRAEASLAEKKNVYGC